MDPRVEIAALTGRIAYNVIKEKVTNPRPTSLREVPPSPEHLTNEWLTLALCDGTPGAAVTGFELTRPRRRDVLALPAERHLQRRRASTSRRSSSRSPGRRSRPGWSQRPPGLSEIETNVYNLILPQLDIEAPTPRYAAYDPISNRQLLITDDMEAHGRRTVRHRPRRAP